MEFKTPFGIDVTQLEGALLKGLDGHNQWDMIVDDIMRFIWGSYALGANPLPHLRLLFPSFTWEFEDLGGGHQWREQLERFIKGADYFWPALYGGDQHFVRARRKDVPSHKPWRIIGVGQPFSVLRDDEGIASHVFATMIHSGARDDHPLHPFG